MMPTRKPVLGIVLAVTAVAAAGCLGPVLGPVDGATDMSVVNLATLVLGDEATSAGEGDPAYFYDSATLDGSWVAYRVPVPESALVTSDRGVTTATVHVVTGFVRDGAVVDEPLPQDPREADYERPILVAVGYSALDDGRSVENFLVAQPGLGAAYRNFTLIQFGQSPLREALLVFGVAREADAAASPREASELAFTLRVGGEEPLAKLESQYREALAEMAVGKRAERVAPTARGDGVNVSAYQEFPADATRGRAVVSRNVDVTDDSPVPRTPLVDAERRVAVRAEQAVASTSRVIGGGGYLSQTQGGEFSWRYEPPGEDAISGTHEFASVRHPFGNMLGLPSGLAFLRVEDAGAVAFEVDFRVRAAALPEVSFVLLAIGVDVAAVFGHSPIEIDPGLSSPLPEPVLRALEDGGVSA